MSKPPTPPRMEEDPIPAASHCRRCLALESRLRVALRLYVGALVAEGFSREDAAREVADAIRGADGLLPW